ncbi:MAG: serine/threonine protein kinase [Cyanobacteria bacterium REEB67]|nr:serine/threonine protein kinase [Cyanobacteria bacterium REEB67]
MTEDEANPSLTDSARGEPGQFASSQQNISYRPGDVIDGHYELTAELGSGGMGSVYACRHVVLDKEYAIKLLSGRKVTPELWTRFQKEAKVLARLDHPGIVKIHNMGVDGGLTPYYVMDLLSGESLADLIKRTKYLPVPQALSFFIQVAGALSSAHAKGIIHRDIKPSNLMVIRDSQNKIARIKIVDFGIARWSKQAAGAQSQTATGVSVGTPFYMSPEQCQGVSVDERSDIYSLGCALFQALTGEPPFRGDNAFQTFMMHQNETPPRLKSRRPGGDFPPELEMAIEKMLRKNPDARYQTMLQVEQILQAIAKGDVGKKRTNRFADSNSFGNAGHSFALADQDSPETGPTGASTGAIKLPRRTGLIIAATLALIASGLYYGLKVASTTSPTGLTSTKALTLDTIELKPSSKPLLEIGCTNAEIEHLGKYNFIAAHEDQEVVEHEFEKLQSFGYRPGFKFLDTSGKSFDFPRNIIIGYIGFGDSKPLAAEGKVMVKPGRRIFYQSYCLHHVDHFIDYFKPGDLQGLELTSHKNTYLREQLKKWKNLETLSFFNSLTRPMPYHDAYDESKIDMDDLKITDQLPRLTTLGVCGRMISGEALARLPVLRRLNSLRIKNINNYEALLKVLPQFPNLHEIWLLTLPVTDAQLEPLTKMPALESLYISRAKITPASIAVLGRLTKLRKLRLNTSWSPEQLAELRRKLPACQCTIERPVVTDYWQTLKQVPVSDYFKDQPVRLPDF